MKRASFLVVWLFFLLCSCASPLKKKLLSEKKPYFDGDIIPISIPVKIKLHPAEFIFHSATIEMIDFDPEFYSGWEQRTEGSFKQAVEDMGFKEGISHEERNYLGKSKISWLGNKLVTETKINAFRFKRKRWVSEVPLYDLRMLQDPSGKILEIELSSPAFEEEGIKVIPKPGTREYDQLVVAFKTLLGLVEYPQHSVGTGDILHSISALDTLKALKALEQAEGDEGFFEEFRQSFEKVKPVAYKVKGWTYVENRKALVAEADYSTKAYLSGIEKIYLRSVGHFLLDAETFQVIKEKIYTQVSMTSSDAIKPWLNYKIYWDYVADLP